jgi:hypothetical protein
MAAPQRRRGRRADRQSAGPVARLGCYRAWLQTQSVMYRWLVSLVAVAPARHRAIEARSPRRPSGPENFAAGPSREQDHRLVSTDLGPYGDYRSPLSVGATSKRDEAVAMKKHVAPAHPYGSIWSRSESWCLRGNGRIYTRNKARSVGCVHDLRSHGDQALPGDGRVHLTRASAGTNRGYCGRPDWDTVPVVMDAGVSEGNRRARPAVK